MALRYPSTPTDALAAFSARAPLPSIRSSAQWNRIAPEIRAASFFSARVEDARFLDRSKGLIDDFLANARDESGKIKVGSKSAFITKMQQFMAAEGMGNTNQAYNDITNLRGGNRLGLIFDTNVRQAYGYAHYTQGLDPLILDQWPAARFVRLEDPLEPRPRHVAGEGDVKLKWDLEYWANWQNGFDIGGFEVPYSPFGFQSLMDQEDVTRAEAESLGLLYPGQPATSPLTQKIRTTSPEEKLQASTKTLDPEIRRGLETELRKYDDRNLSEDKLLQEQAARDREDTLYGMMDAENAMPVPDRQRIESMEQELRMIGRERSDRGTQGIFRIKRGIGRVFRFLGDMLFRRGN